MTNTGFDDDPIVAKKQPVSFGQISSATLQKEIAARILQTNPDRIGFFVANDSKDELFLGFDSTVSDTKFWVAVPKKSTFQSFDAITNEIWVFTKQNNGTQNVYFAEAQ